MKISEKEKALFDYMQEQANNLLDYCERNKINISNPGFFVDPASGYAHIAASTEGNERYMIYTRNKSQNLSGGNWEKGISVLVIENGKVVGRE